LRDLQPWEIYLFWRLWLLWLSGKFIQGSSIQFSLLTGSTLDFLVKKLQSLLSLLPTKTTWLLTDYHLEQSRRETRRSKNMSNDFRWVSITRGTKIIISSQAILNMDSTRWLMLLNILDADWLVSE
jgi:hypothetical protein